jgi:ferredoxin
MTKVMLGINGKSVTAEVGATLSEVFKSNDFVVTQFCGGQGICASCHFAVLAGPNALTEPTSQEEMMCAKTGRSGVRYACQTKVVGQGGHVMLAPPKR